ncbi:unnamed protein product [Staurois parvus]|uniref:Uncharacterized protein n=1 Tax=Staurois parvus TaxID=386267 RepID=A0ABN9GGU6_9NEOB|nr:unnamed protein product [Staurois parvus]
MTSSHSHRACAAQGVCRTAIGGALCPSDTADHRSRKEPKMSAPSSVPPVSVHQCLVSVLISATCQCPSVPHQCHISVPTSAHQCHIVPI